MGDLLDKLPEGGAWTVIALILILLFGPLALASEEGSKKLWIFGRAARWFASRRERSVERERRLKESTTDHLRAEIEQLRRDFRASEERSRDREERSRKRDRDQQRRLDQQMAWMEFATAWARDVILMAAERGWHPPLPKWSSFSEWEEDHKKLGDNE